MLTFVEKSPLRDEYLSVYHLDSEHNAIDMIKELVKNPDLKILRGEARSDHDAGCGSSSDYNEYATLEAFFWWKDYENHRHDVYSFDAEYKGIPFKFGFGNYEVVTLSAEDEALDLIKILKGE